MQGQCKASLQVKSCKKGAAEVELKWDWTAPFDICAERLRKVCSNVDHWANCSDAGLRYRLLCRASPQVLQESPRAFH